MAAPGSNVYLAGRYGLAELADDDAMLAIRSPATATAARRPVTADLAAGAPGAPGTAASRGLTEADTILCTSMLEIDD